MGKSYCSCGALIKYGAKRCKACVTKSRWSDNNICACGGRIRKYWAKQCKACRLKSTAEILPNCACGKKLTRKDAIRCRSCDSKYRWAKGGWCASFNTPESRRLASERGKRICSNPDHLEKMKQGAKIYYSKEENKLKRSEQRREMWRKEEYRVKQARNNVERYTKVAIKQKEIWNDPIYKAGMVKRFRSEEVKLKRGISQKKRYSNPEVRKKQSEKMKRIMNLPEIKKKYSWIYTNKEMLQKMREGRLNQTNLPCQFTSIELKVIDELNKRDIKFKPQKPLLDKYQADIFIPPNIVIECDGDYWHNYPFGTKQDRQKETDLKQANYIVYRFWEHEINEDVQRCVDMIKEVK